MATRAVSGPIKWLAAILRAYGSWGAMSRTFEWYFFVEENVILNDLDSLRCQGFNIAKYTEEYNAKAVRLTHPLDHGTMTLVMRELINGLPFLLLLHKRSDCL